MRESASVLIRWCYVLLIFNFTMASYSDATVFRYVLEEDLLHHQVTDRAFHPYTTGLFGLYGSSYTSSASSMQAMNSASSLDGMHQ